MIYVVTAHFDNLDPRVLDLQSRCLARLWPKDPNWQRRLVRTELHAEALHHVLDCMEEDDVLFSLDADALPLNAWIMPRCVHVAKQRRLVGVAQRACHLPYEHDYVGPAFAAFTKRFWMECDYPDLRETWKGGPGWNGRECDVLEALTYAAEAMGKIPEFIWPAFCRQEMWMTGKTRYGIGTFYGEGPDVYHTFFIRDGGRYVDEFVRTAEEILNNVTPVGKCERAQ